MTDKEEIERLRACIIIDRMIMQALFEEIPIDLLEKISSNASSKFEQFTTRSTYSTMPESFVVSQRESSESWESVFQKVLTKRHNQQKPEAHREQE